MRETKFRVWDKKEKRMKYVLQLEWHTDHSGKLIAIHTYPLGIYMNNHPNSKRIDDLILIQYTGLKDKNGKEIHEGDIVENQYDDYVIKFIDGEFAMISKLRRLPMINVNKSKIIGNIYENLELLGNK